MIDQVTLTSHSQYKCEEQISVAAELETSECVSKWTDSICNSLISFILNKPDNAQSLAFRRCSNYVAENFGIDAYAGRSWSYGLDDFNIDIEEINLREKFNFAFKVFGQILSHEIFDDEGNLNFYRKLECHGFNSKNVMRSAKIAKEKHNCENGRLIPYRDWFKAPWFLNSKIQKQVRLGIFRYGSKSMWSDIIRQISVIFPCQLGAKERLLSNPKGDENVPWLDASRLWQVDPLSKYCAFADEIGIVSVTGPSGIVSQTLLFCWITQTKISDAFLACVSYLVPIGAHSIDEIAFSFIIDELVDSEQLVSKIKLEKIPARSQEIVVASVRKAEELRLAIKTLHVN